MIRRTAGSGRRAVSRMDCCQRSMVSDALDALLPLPLPLPLPLGAPGGVRCMKGSVTVRVRVDFKVRVRVKFRVKVD